jgi:hypothetical protein
MFYLLGCAVAYASHQSPAGTTILPTAYKTISLSVHLTISSFLVTVFRESSASSGSDE